MVKEPITHASIEDALFSIEAKLAGAAAILAEARLRRGIEAIIVDYSRSEDTYGLVARLRRVLEAVDVECGSPPQAVGWRTGDPPCGVRLWVTVQPMGFKREVWIAEALRSFGGVVVWYNAGRCLYHPVLAWMPMTAPEPAP